MPKQINLQDDERERLLKQLDEKYGHSRRYYNRLIFFRKKYAWLFVITCSKLLKRLIDIAVSVWLMIALSPLFLCIAILIKCTDKGPVLYISKRVGKDGEEFNFPKFRSMKIAADCIKNQLIDQNIHKNNITFKIRNDPRTTWIGRILRRTSLDELPQLWCVLKGEMSLVGPRPPLREEVEKYTLEERRRLDITPGLTCIWQVSGRSDIPFAMQLKLDLEYIESQSFLLDIKLLLKTIPAVLLGRGAY